VLRFAIPAGSIIAAAAFAAYALARAHGLPLVQQRTAATLVTLILSLCVLVLLAVPLTWRRVALVGAALAGFALLFPVPAVRRFYELRLPSSGLPATLAVAALGTAALTGFGSCPAGAAADRRRRPAVTATSEPRPGASPSPLRPDIPEMKSRQRLVLFVHRPGSGAAPPRGAPAGLPLTPVPAAAATRIRANPWRPFCGQDMTCHAYGFAGWCCAVTGALPRCTMRSRRTAAYPRVDRAPTISRSVTGSGWVCSRSRRKGT